MAKAKKNYIWQLPDWPHFTWDEELLLPALSRVRNLQGQIIATASFLGLEEQAQIVTNEAMTTSAIEGEKLDRQSVRSSVARRLGLSKVGLSVQQRSVEGLVEMLLDATKNWNLNLTGICLKGWHAALFPTGFSGLNKISTGKWRTGDEPMRVVSGSSKGELVHYEAPPSSTIPNQMKEFLSWWKRSRQEMDGIIRAGVAHFYFISIHPFDDGNGRIARCLTDMALAQDEKVGTRLYSLSSQIIQRREEYYNILESSQKGTCDISAWLLWFLDLLGDAIQTSRTQIQKSLDIAKFWQVHSEISINERQRKVLQKLLEAEPLGFQGGMTNRKYVSLTRTSRETAKRDLADLEDKNLIKRNAGMGRSISYSLVK